MSSAANVVAATTRKTGALAEAGIRISSALRYQAQRTSRSAKFGVVKARDAAKGETGNAASCRAVSLKSPSPASPTITAAPKAPDSRILRLVTGPLAHLIDPGCQVARPEAVVNVDHRHPGRTAVYHPQ